MASFLKTIGWIAIIGGFIVGIISGFRNDPVHEILGMDPGFRFTATLAWWIGGLFSGVAYIALGMILEQQEDLSRTVYAINRNVRDESSLRFSKHAHAKGYKMSVPD